VIRKLALAILFGLLTATPPACASSIDSVLLSALTGTKTPAVGAVIIKNGKVTEIAVHGVRRNDGKDPVRLDDVWVIGSVAKPMTAAMIARLVERGRLSWDSPLSKMLPGLVHDMRPEYRSVTLDELLSHRSGLPHDVSDMKFNDAFFDDNRPLPQQRLAYVRRALQERPAIPPGTGSSYSNTGFILAAVIAERATGVSYEQLMRREVFAPLGMRSAGFGPTHEGQLMGHHAGRPATPRDSAPLMMAPAGIVHMRLGDWAKFCVDQLAGAKGHGKLLSAATYLLMQSPHPGTDVGLDWGVDPSVAGFKGPVLQHGGSDGNWRAIAILFPESGNGLLIGANTGQDMGGDVAAKGVFKALLPTVSAPVNGNANGSAN
jgi:CubicO group peptidase (beta-lactamase class C family)